MIKKNCQKGTVVIITFLVLVILLLLGSYFLVFAITETRISKSQEAGARTYYLAEAGINELIWKIKNRVSPFPVFIVDFGRSRAIRIKIYRWNI
ncbi:unnamed protein product [marine sediment metagenome]|uniref:Type 4 fimbrial biogenesis protein PilX N-terminal domain-containing protein n=1 Tax=marine sediment metagenome TaxID=412755 RepID=X1R2I4_9ZZZZ